ncbi:glycerol-3-phosphate 1-O-acyltransferase PlsY [Alphaproteobacteria bacterium]|jgi:glycerol-3-phosphate acyltransferase PlsY|nr:glycerol-3-phosphate 1-O-acyltransferase PlsY [Alphaproteobacteria bacterium]|tara:strand:+ start:2045 stop:2674 length:630 start_codon:yes stop_codon:yes gene_type:complete
MINDLNYYWILISLFLFGYFIGSIPFGLILTKLSGLGDIRNIGSGNIGATNVLRTGNKKIALLTLILDGGKGALAIFITSLFFNFFLIRSFIDLELLQSLVAVGAVIGHCFPVWLRFRGGKGVATGFGLIITLNIFVGLAALLIWIITTKIFKISSMSALLAYLLIPILMFFNSTENYFLIASLMISSICWFQHRENIRRLINGSEPKI